MKRNLFVKRIKKSKKGADKNLLQSKKYQNLNEKVESLYDENHLSTIQS